MKKLITILFVCLTVNAISQDNNGLYSLGLLFGYNLESISNSQINDYLVANDYYSSSNILSNNSLGFSIRPLKHTSIINVNFNYGVSLLENSNEKTIFNSSSFGFEYLYDLIKPDEWLIAPIIGLRLNNYKLMAVSKYATSVLSKNYLEEAFHTNLSPSLNIGMQIDRKIKIHYLDLFLGIKGGYNLSFLSSNWYNSSQQKLNTIPAINLSGFNFGFCGRIEFNIEKMLKK
mgnify:CR=1 FL=1